MQTLVLNIPHFFFWRVPLHYIVLLRSRYADNSNSPVIFNVLEQLFELSGLDCEEGDEAGGEQQEGVDPALEGDQEAGRGDEERREAVGRDVRHRQGQPQRLHRGHHQVLG